MFFLTMRFLAACVAMALASALFAPSSVTAAGLGRLSVASALGQPLNAEIEVVSSTPGDLATLAARLAHPDAYRNAGLEYAPDLTRLEFAVVPRGGGRVVIRVTSATPVTEPVLNLLLEVSWSGGKLQRRFAMLLDPPGYGAQVATMAPAPPVVPPPASALPPPVVPMPRPAPLPPPASLGVPVTPSASPAVVPSAPVTAPPPAMAGRPPTTRPAAPVRPPPAPAPKPSGPEGAPASYGPVQRGETLGQIAQKVRPEGMPLPQVVAALYAENPGAFVGENMNRLMAGSTLRVPTAEQIGAIPLADASKLVAAHVAGRRASLADVASLPESRASVADPAAVRGRLSPAIDSARLPAPPSGSDTLKLSRGPDDRGAAAASERLSAKQEDLTAREQTIRDARTRISELQQQIRDVERLLTLAAAGAGTGAGGGAGALPASAPTASASAGTPASEPAPAGSSPPGSGGADAPAGSVVAPAVSSGPPPPAKSRAPAPPPPERTLLDELQGDLLWVAALVVVALGIGGILLVRRRQQQGPLVAAAPGGPLAPRVKGAPVPRPAAPVAGTVVVNEAEILADLDKASTPPARADEADPVAEADSLITYGRYAQAEEVLRAALEGQPPRPQVALRLLELYHAKKDTVGFENVAQELKATVGEASAVWRKAAVLGAQIDAANPLYGAGRAGPSSPAGPAGARLAATAESTPSADVPPLDFVAGILNEPVNPKPGTVAAEPLELDMPPHSFSDSSAAAPADAASKLADTLLSEPAAKPAGKGSDGVGTRLDLAKAYLEIGDKDGAKDLLREVARSGSEAQRAEAEKLLGSL